MAVYIKEDFYSRFLKAIKEDDRVKLDDMILDEIAKVSEYRKKDVIDLLKKTDIKVDKDASVGKVINLIVKSVPKKKKFRYGMAIIIADHNKIFKPKQASYGRTVAPEMEQKETDQRFWNAVHSIQNQIAYTWGMNSKIKASGKEQPDQIEVGSEKLKEIESRIRKKAGLGKKTNTLVIVGVGILVITVIAAAVVAYKNKGAASGVNSGTGDIPA